MARMARVVVPGIPHHITQRGNRRQEIFFKEEDYEEYKSLMREWCNANGVEIWAYCLMPNHVHMIAVPEEEDSLAKGIGEAHRRYSRYINFREGWRGYLMQGRYSSFPMDEEYTLKAARYIELNPVRAKIVRKAWRYNWSSSRSRIKGYEDSFLDSNPLEDWVGDWREHLESDIEDKIEVLEKHERTGRPLGSEAFVRKLEKKTGRVLRPQKGGRPRRRSQE